LLIYIRDVVRLPFREWLTESRVITASGLGVEWDKSMAACSAERRRPSLGGLWLWGNIICFIFNDLFLKLSDSLDSGLFLLFFGFLD
jgi:hypothetical protein